MDKMKEILVVEALDPCIMEDDRRATLTVGKRYLAELTPDKSSVILTDDRGDIHFFDHPDQWRPASGEINYLKVVEINDEISNN